MMAARPIWRGHLRLALVSCPVALVSARHERNNLHFNLINPATSNRIRMVTLDAETGEELERGDLVRGYEFKKDHFVLLTEEDFDSARIESSSLMTIAKFVPSGSIDPLYYDSSYLLVPDGEAGQDVYAVLRDAFARTKTMALSRLVLARRERAVAIMAHGKGMVLHTLHEAADLTDTRQTFSDVPAAKPDAAMVKLAEQLIARQTGEYDPSDVEDRYEAKLRELIDAKVAGTGLDPEDRGPEDSGNVIDLMEALKRSLAPGASRQRAKAVPAKKGKPAATVKGAAKRGAKRPPRTPATARRAR